MDVLEPSAGNGVLAEAARKAGGNVDVVELEQQLRDILKEKGFNIVGSDFDEFTPDKLYDRVLMNPPFSHDLDIKHVQKAFEHLKPGGKLVAIVSTMAGERSNKRNQTFREWLDELGAREEKLPEGMFKESMNPTNVATKLLTLTKPDEVNRSNPTNAITGEIILKAMRQKQKARLKKERGLALSRKDEHLRTLGRFGSYESVL